MTPIKPATSRVLVVGALDSTRQAGLQADIETVAALSGQAAIAVAALVTQGAHGVLSILDVPPAFFREQLRALTAAVGADAFKTGMLADAARIEVVAEMLADFSGTPFVLDLAMADWGGMLTSGTLACLKRALMPLASILMLDVEAAEALSGRMVNTTAEMEHVAEMLLTLGPPAVLLRGGRLSGETVSDVLITGDGAEAFTGRTGEPGPDTGCRLASAVATGLAQGMDVRDAVIRARAYVQACSPVAPVSERTPLMARG